MKRLLVALGAVTVVVLLAGVFAPATLVAARVEQATGGAWRLVEARGRVWDGTATLADRGGRVAVPVAWHVEALPLLRGEARVHLGPPGALRADLVLRRDAVEASAAEIVLPATLLPLPPGVVAGGELRMTSDTVALVGGTTAGRVEVDWRGARLTLPGTPVIDLGTVTLQLAAEGARWRGPLAARGGVATLDGDVSVDGSGADLALRMVPQAGGEFLRGLGTPDAQGAIPMRLAPRWR